LEFVIPAEAGIFRESSLGDGAGRRVTHGGTRAARGCGTTFNGANMLMRAVFSNGTRWAFSQALANQFADHG
jgi:hypothetical protein